MEDEFNSIWQTIEGDLKRQNRTFADEDTTEEKAREEYRGIAERRVRLGLVLAEIGEKNSIKVTEEEISARHRRACAPGARPRAGGLGLLPQEPAGGGRHPRADLRGEGGRLPLELAKVTDKP